MGYSSRGCKESVMTEQLTLSFSRCVRFSTGFPGGTVVKNLPVSAGDTSLITGLGRSPGGGHGNPLQYSGLENPMDRGAWWATGHGVAESDTSEVTSTEHARNANS